jgi:isoquinoline 1-oxidoreductase alpha subunit
MALDLTINGRVHRVDADPQTPLLWIIRDHVGLTGTKFSCGIGQCGACTGARRRPRHPLLQRACLDGRRQTDPDHRGRVAGRLASDSDGLEGIRRPQCGYCQSGMIMAALALLTTARVPPTPTSTRASPTPAGAARITVSGRRFISPPI